MHEREALKTVVMVIGFKGEVGRPLYELLRGVEEYEVIGLDIEPKEYKGKVDIMHICYPCDDEQKFIQTTIQYMKRFNPKLTIINSTVPPGTTEKIHQLTKMPIVHSPVRGMIPHMKHDLLHFIKYIGGVDEESAKLAQEHFERIGIPTKICKGPKETELAKIINTTYYALLIAWFQEIYRLCEELGVSYEDVVDFIKTTEGRPVLYPGYIGGHCLIPNIKLLLTKVDSDFLRLILESNERWKEKYGTESPARGTLRKDSWKFQKKRVQEE